MTPRLKNTDSRLLSEQCCHMQRITPCRKSQRSFSFMDSGAELHIGPRSSSSSRARAIRTFMRWKIRLTSLADDAARTRKMVASQKGPVLLVGHSYGGAVITEAGTHDNVVGLVYIAAFAPDAGESPGAVAQKYPSPGGGRICSSTKTPSPRSVPLDQAGQIPRELLPGPDRATKAWSWASPRRRRWSRPSATTSAFRPGRANPPGTRSPAKTG